MWTSLTYSILLRVAQRTDGHRLLGGDLLAGAVADEQRLSAPLERHRFALGNVGQLDLDLGQRQHVGGRAHRADELVHHRLGGVRGRNGGAYDGRNSLE